MDKKIVFIAHDPGGYDVVYPVFNGFVQEGYKDVELFCIGPAGRLNQTYNQDENVALNRLREYITGDSLFALITGTSWGTDVELEALLLCNEAGIVTFSILDYWVSYKSRMIDKKGNLVYPHYYILMDELAKKEAVEEGVPGECIRVLGHPGIDKWASYSNMVTRNNPGSDSILFLSQPLSMLYGDSLGYTEDMVIGDIVKAAEIKGKSKLSIKFHPKDSDKLIEKYGHLAVQGELQKLFPEYGLIVGMSTMALLYSVLLGIPTVSYQPNLQGKDICITNKLGLTKMLGSVNELVDYLEDFGNGLTMLGGNKALKNYLWSDGLSTQRVCSFIKNTLNI